MAEARAFLKALTPEARASLGMNLYPISRFPFRVGRECRDFRGSPGFPDSRRRPDSAPNNELYLVELGAMLSVSREHFAIDRIGNGFVIVDRGSSCGTLVEGEQVGERKKTSTRPLHNNDVIIVGTSESRFVFKFILAEES